jgi:nondiscriminating glutamyl-tRNA synthetase
MSVRVRFAPSPTGLLHIGGARTALYCLLFAKARGGKCILRIEDTDLERSRREFEEAQIKDMLWCGLEFDEGPHIGGDYGPYRQSERLDLYKKYAWQLVEQGHAYPCFLTAKELEELTAKAEEQKLAPHTYHNHYRELDLSASKKRIEQGEDYVIRFKNPQKVYEFSDLVRGNVRFQEDMVGDFVILRSNGLPVYNFCCVVDDALMKITHVIRAEEHLNNTVRQLMLYEALDFKIPEFAHVSLLIGEDRQKLSKRHGATSVAQYREQHYLPDAMMNYLCLLGWSHPEEKDIFSVNELGALFTLDRFSKSPALYDVQKLDFFNEQHLRLMPDEKILAHCLQAADKDKDQLFLKQEKSWQLSFIALYKEKIQLVTQLLAKVDEVFSIEQSEEAEYIEALGWESTPVIKQYLQQQIQQLLESQEAITAPIVGQWMDALKKDLKIKGKPLFMGTRAVLTGTTHGPDLKELLALTPVEIIQKRLENLK